ncbi:MAG TPA: carbon-nitrogen hydrolase family protein [Gaiellaceae bacterium]|jgi:predicted amidohydrolase
MSRTVEAAALQLLADPGRPELNLERLALAVRDCAGADLIVAGELVNSGYDLDVIDRDAAELAEPLDGVTVTLTRTLAGETGATIVVGLLERHEDGLYDTAVVVPPDGPVVPYRKSHLYPPERERFAAGDELLQLETPAGRLGVMICFEHAFPEIATALALEGAEIIAIPSAVPYGYEHLLTLRSRARAQDNQLFVVASNLAGNGFCGGSLIVDPRGEVLAQAGTGEETIRARLDLGAIEREREREPALRLRRPTLYR